MKWSSLPVRIAGLLSGILICHAILHSNAFSETEPFNWQPVREGLLYGTYRTAHDQFPISSSVVLVKIDPDLFHFRVSRARELGVVAYPVEKLTKAADAVIGINANFFDLRGEPLGLVISRSKTFGRLHRSGRLLTGVFAIKDSQPTIIHRDEFNPTNVSEAIQAGPRLIEHGRPLRLRSPHSLSPRSGLALTESNKVILYASLGRFPGVSFHQVQSMLLHPHLEVKHALNLDGGGSSQMIMRKTGSLRKDLVIGGTDEIPVALVVIERRPRESRDDREAAARPGKTDRFAP